MSELPSSGGRESFKLIPALVLVATKDCQSMSTLKIWARETGHRL